MNLIVNSQEFKELIIRTRRLMTDARGLGMGNDLEQLKKDVGVLKMMLAQYGLDFYQIAEKWVEDNEKLVAAAEEEVQGNA